jgi:protocatechuate 3,4-dioxygenase beta subunit
MEFTRRNLLTTTISTLGLLGATSAFGRVEEFCARTPQQPEGPFYPVRDQPDKDNDLTYVSGRRGVAKGTVVYLQGIVSDVNCTPIKHAVVEIWQACASGRYNHPGDQENPGALDPNFQYWGIATSDKNGLYTFKTILPGHYKAAPDWMRPPHIHFKVHKMGHHELTTQMYFSGNQYNEGDLILRKLSAHEKAAVIVPMIKRENASAADEFDCAFNITLTSVA